jgi:3-oxoacyl-(acyl-carrier-protein) synthase
LRIRPVPTPEVRPRILAHPRLRRANPVTLYGAAAALEATERLSTRPGAPARIGLVVCLQTGCVQYSSRFYEETLKEPATASPLVFPETVFAAPASHIGTLLGNVTVTTTLVGDPATFLQGVALAVDWLREEQTDLVLVVGAEEPHWLVADALKLFSKSAILASGAGALCLARDPALSLGVELACITAPHLYSSRRTVFDAAREMRAQLGPGAPDELLCDGLTGSARWDQAESSAWRDWPGSRVSVKKCLGEGLMAAAAWQCVAACDALAHSPYSAASVSLVGCNEQALGARFVRPR